MSQSTARVESNATQRIALHCSLPCLRFRRDALQHSFNRKRVEGCMHVTVHDGVLDLGWLGGWGNGWRMSTSCTRFNLI
jgi:hypothetical protein